MGHEGSRTSPKNRFKLSKRPQSAAIKSNQDNEQLDDDLMPTVKWNGQNAAKSIRWDKNIKTEVNSGEPKTPYYDHKEAASSKDTLSKNSTLLLKTKM